MGKSNKEIQELYRTLVQNDFCSYVQYTNPGWIPTRFHRRLCNEVQDFITRQTSAAYDILVIDTPPQHGKSQTITETLPSWYFGHFPRNKVIEISYSEDFAERFGRRNKQKIAEYGGLLFGIELADSPCASTEFELSNHTGGMISRGIMSGVTGHGANLMIIDDPVKTQEEADSNSRQSKIWNEWLSSFTSRLAPHAKVIIIMTRWSENDLVGHLLDMDGISIQVLNFPLEAEPNDILGRPVGAALCPEIGKDDAWLKEFKKMLLSREGSRTWNALYQGHPVALEGNLIHRDWWRYYTELPKDIPEYIMSVDAAFKDGDDNDFVAIQVWGKKDADMYLIDAVKKHLDMPSTCREIVRLRGMYSKCRTTLIEDKANGSAIIQILRKKIGGIISVDPFGGKVSRVNAIAGAIESGNCYLPDNKPFTPDFVDECAAFPNGQHDDQVDAMSQCLNRLIYHNAKSPIKKAKNAMEEAFPFLKQMNKKTSTGLGDALNVI